MSVLIVLVMCVAVQATGCPGSCQCREVVTCHGGVSALKELPPATSRLAIRPPPAASVEMDLPALLAAIAGLPRLADLSLADCSIADLANVTSHGLERLTALDLSRNLITELSEETSFNQSALRTLDVSHNLIRVIHGSPFRTLCSLEVLNLSGNAIDCVPVDSFCGLRGLLSLDLAANNLTALQDEMFVSLSSLQHLNLSKNQLETLSESCFASLQRLQQLDLSWNRLTQMAPGTLQALPSLSRLMIAGNSALGGGNKDGALLVGTGRRLQTLDASRTGLEHVPAALTHSVRTLRLASNSIRTVQCGDLDSYPLLQLLDLTSNILEEMEEDALGRLEMLVILYLTDNKLHAIPRSLPDEMKILHLEYNGIEQIVSGDLLGLPKLEVLLLNDNNIKVVQEGAFSQMTSLITLDLSRNPISILPAGTLSGPSQLQVLRLSSLTVDPPAEDMTFPVPSPEHLVRLDLSHSPGLARQLLADKAALVAFRELQELNLTTAGLINLQSDLLHFLPQLRDLHITGNRLNCTGLLWLALWMRVQDQPDQRQVICVTPPELYGTLVVDLQDTDVEATTTEMTTTVTLAPVTNKYSRTATDSTLAAVIDANVQVENTFNNITEVGVGVGFGAELSTVRGLQNTYKSFEERPDETVKSTIGEMAAGTSTVTAVPRHRSDTPDAASTAASADRVHLLPMGIEISTVATGSAVTDGHIARINPTDNRASIEPYNYTVEVDPDFEADVPASEVSRVAASATAASRDNERVAELLRPLPPYANQSGNSSFNGEITHDLPAGEGESEGGDNTTGRTSMYSSSSRVAGEASGRAVGLVHPGMLVLLAAVLGAGVALSTLVSHVRRRRKRNAPDGGCYSRQQDIEVNSLPGIGDLW